MSSANSSAASGMISVCFLAAAVVGVVFCVDFGGVPKNYYNKHMPSYKLKYPKRGRRVLKNDASTAQETEFDEDDDDDEEDEKSTLEGVEVVYPDSRLNRSQRDFNSSGASSTSSPAVSAADSSTTTITTTTTSTIATDPNNTNANNNSTINTNNNNSTKNSNIAFELWNKQGTELYSQEKFKEALQYYERSVGTFESQAPNSSELATIYRNMAKCHFGLLQYERALDYAQSSLDIPLEQSQRNIYQDQQHQQQFPNKDLFLLMGFSHRHLQNYHKAIDWFQQILSSSSLEEQPPPLVPPTPPEQLKKENLETRAQILNAIGICQYLLHDYNEALQSFSSAMESAEQIESVEVPRIIRNIVLSMQARLGEGKQEEALVCFERCNEMLDADDSEYGNQVLVLNLCSMAQLCIQIQQYERALDLYDVVMQQHVLSQNDQDRWPRDLYVGRVQALYGLHSQDYDVAELLVQAFEDYQESQESSDVASTSTGTLANEEFKIEMLFLSLEDEEPREEISLEAFKEISRLYRS